MQTRLEDNQIHLLLLNSASQSRVWSMDWEALSPATHFSHVFPTAAVPLPLSFTSSPNVKDQGT
jgi:hypothetical protein